MRTLLIVLAALTPLSATLPGLRAQEPAASSDHVPVVFSGGHETDPRDGGRPVVLVAAGLKVPPEVFRQAFSHVHPAGPGSGGPTDAEARANKQALMSALAPYGVTDERLNQVSNYYRYASWKGEMWKNQPAAAYAVMDHGNITSFVVTDGGAGYSSPPNISVAGKPVPNAQIKLAFVEDLAKNGSVAAITIGPKDSY